MKKVENKKYNIDIIYALFIPLIIIGKFIRYTLMKTVLVDVGIGHNWINTILYGDLNFSVWQEETIASTRDNAILFFQKINFLNLDSYVSWEVYITIIFNLILLLIIIKMRLSKLNFRQLVFITLSIVVLNIFDFCLAKEPVQMLYFIAIFLILLSKRLSEKHKFIFSLMIVMFSAITLRNYYILIAFFMVVTYFLCNIFIIKKDNVKLKNIIFMLCILGLIYYIVLKLCAVISPDNYQELIRVRTRTSTAASDMRNIFPSSNLILFVVDYIIMLIRMLIPVELLTLGVKYFPYVFYQLIITYFLIKNLRKIKTNSKIKNIAIYTYLGFLLGSATFEPDFGSWIRHEAVLFPIFLIIIKQEENKGEIECEGTCQIKCNNSCI